MRIRTQQNNSEYNLKDMIQVWFINKITLEERVGLE